MSDTQKFLLNVLSVLAIGAVVLRMTIIEVFVVDSNAMAPTLTYGDEVLVLTTGSYELADILVCEHPLHAGMPVLGRALAFAGHTISTGSRGELLVDGDRATINLQDDDFRFLDVVRGQELRVEVGEVQYFGRHDHAFMRTPKAELNFRATTVKEGAYLMGDNRREWTLDSREFGEVDLNNCMGKVVLRWKAAPSNGDDIDNGMLELVR